MRRTIPAFASATLAGALPATTAIGDAAGPALANVPTDVDKSDRGRAQNVILLVGDGMGRTRVTADHECAGFNIIEKGTFTNAEALTPPSNVDSGNTANNSTPSRTQRSTLDPARSTGPVNGAGAGNAGNFAPATFCTADDAADVQDGSPEASLRLTYLSGNHTGADVPVYSYGPGSSAMSGTLDNTDLFGIMTDALRLGR